MTTMPDPYRGLRFPAEIIAHAVWLETLERWCRDPDYVARLQKTCETINAIIRRYEPPAPADEMRPLFRWLLHWAYLWPRDESAIERYIEAQTAPNSPHRIWLDLHLPTNEKARLRSLLVSTTEAAALSLSTTAVFHACSVVASGGGASVTRRGWPRCRGDAAKRAARASGAAPAQ